MRWRERMQRFMIGRYGTDQLNRALLIVSFVLIILSNFGLTFVFYTIGLVLLLFANLRIFSRNHKARYRENMIFMSQVNKLKYLISKLKYKKDMSKTHHIYTCPQCKQKIRIPKGKGKIMVRCPKCRVEFVKKS